MPRAAPSRPTPFRLRARLPPPPRSSRAIPPRPQPTRAARNPPFPAPLPPGARADTPGGSARNGVIAPPPAAGDHDINKGAPGAAALGTPVIRPPGSPGGDTRVIPSSRVPPTGA